MWIEATIFVICLLAWWVINDRRKYKGVPPGPPRLPILGNLPYLWSKSVDDPAIAFVETAKTYGDITFLKIGQLDAVVFSSHEGIVDILNHEKAHTRGGVSKIPLQRDRAMHGKNIGLLWANGDVWSTIRRFTLRTLRDFGFGKQLSMDFVINEELQKFMTHVDKLIAKNDGVLHFDGFFDLTIINILWRLVTGVSYSLDDPRMNYLLRISNEQVRSSSFAYDISIAFPFLWDWFPSFFGTQNALKIIGDIRKFSQDTIDEHRESGQYASDPKGFIDIFLQKIDENKNDAETHFDDINLNMTIVDLFQAGAETTSKSLAFAVLYMLSNPKIQEKVYEEITSNVPDKEPITISYKAQMPYCCATLLEVLRYSTVLPFPPMRQASEDFMYKGYLIKKGTALIPNTGASHFDVRDFEDPLVFRPERFIKEDGTINTQLEAHVLPFGGGKRLCVGKTLAEASLFLYFTTLMRNYKFSKVANTPDPPVSPLPGITYSPQPFKVNIVRRDAINNNTKA